MGIYCSGHKTSPYFEYWCILEWERTNASIFGGQKVKGQGPMQRRGGMHAELDAVHESFCRLLIVIVDIWIGIASKMLSEIYTVLDVSEEKRWTTNTGLEQVAKDRLYKEREIETNFTNV